MITFRVAFLRISPLACISINSEHESRVYNELYNLHLIFPP